MDCRDGTALDALETRLDGRGRQVGTAHARESAAKAADGSPDRAHHDNALRAARGRVRTCGARGETLHREAGAQPRHGRIWWRALCESGGVGLCVGYFSPIVNTPRSHSYPTEDYGKLQATRELSWSDRLLLCEVEIGN